MTNPFVIAKTAAGEDVAVPAGARQPPRARSPAPPAPARPSRCRCSPSISRASACRCSWPTSRAISPASPPPARCRRSSRERLKATGLDGAGVGAPTRSCSGTCSASSGLPVRATISDMGPLLLGAPARPERDAAGRAGARLQDRRRQRAAAARPEGPARDAAVRRRQRARSSRPTTATSRRRRSARSSARCSRSSSRAATQFFGEPMLDIDDLLQTDGTGRGIVNILAADELMQLAEALRDVPAVDAVGAVRAAAGSRRSARSRSSCSSSTRRTCCSPTRRRRCSRRSSRSCG